MFRIISNKTYKKLTRTAEEIKAQVNETFKTIFDESDAKIKRLEKDNKESEDALEVAMYNQRALKSLNKELGADVDKYKTLYADELNKRLELAERVRGMEDDFRDVSADLSKAISDYKELEALIPKQIQDVRSYTARSFLRALRQGVPRLDGRMSREPDDIIAFMEHRYEEGDTQNEERR